MKLNIKCQIHLIAIILIIILFFIVRVTELKNVGETWDEEPKVRNGQIHIKALSESDFSTETWKIHRMHPPLGKILLALPTYLNRFTNYRFETDKYYNEGKNYFLSRVLVLSISSATLYLVYLITKKISSRTYGIISVILLSILPHFVAHEFISTLEAIQLMFLMLLIYVVINLNLDKYEIKKYIILGLLLGASFLTKFSSLIFSVIPFIYIYIKKFTEINDFKSYKSHAFKYLKINFIIIFIGLATFYVFWPWIWPNPIARLMETSNSLLREARTEIFLGAYNELPWYYFIFYFCITTPITYLIMFCISLWLLISKKSFNSTVLFILICFLIPFLTSFSGFKQNGVRYLYTSFASFIIFITWGLFELEKRYTKKITIPVLSIIISFGVYTNFQISPYYLDYYNELVGGTKNVADKQIAQIGWWGEGALETVKYANENLPKDSRICLDFIPRHVVPKFRKDLKVQVDCLYEKDYLIINRMYRQQTRIGRIDNEHELIYSVKAGGADFVEIYRIHR